MPAVGLDGKADRALPDARACQRIGVVQRWRALRRPRVDTLTDGRVVGRTRVRGRPGVYREYPFGTGLNSGHVVLVWHVGGTTYAISLHGHTAVNERLDEAIADHLVLFPG